MIEIDSRSPFVSGLLAAFLVVASAACLPARVPDSWRDDANLNAVHFTDRSTGWAVGDRGAAFQTTDGGETWTARPIADEVSLRSVFFLTSKVGWAAGGTTTPFTQTEPGSVYRTDDSGVTWRRVNTSPVPRVHTIRFFNSESGILAGAAGPQCPSGVMVTADGGETWQPLDPGLNQNPGGWRGAAFPKAGRGAVVGVRGRRAVVGASQLIESRDTAESLRGLHAVTLNEQGVGWAVGDGGTLRRTSDGGLVWQEPATPLPQEVREFFDCRTVSVCGTHIRVAGQPGGVIWHSADDGHSWQPEPLPSTLPIASVYFCTEQEGIAVGAMGVIFKTSNGRTWKAVKGADRRAALLHVGSDPKTIPFTTVATLAGDQGYRAVSVLPVRHDLQSGEFESSNLDVRTHDAMVTAGGNAATTEWALPLLVPDLDRDRDALVKDWSRRTEGKLQNVLVGRMVSAIRTWRPEIILIEEPDANDAVAELIFQAMKVAVSQAADSTRFVEQRVALPPWQTKKLYVRKRSASSGDAVVECHVLLPRIGMTALDFGGNAAACVTSRQTKTSENDHFDLIPLQSAKEAAPFFAGIDSAPGSSTRRPVGAPEIDDRQRELLARQRTIRGFAEVAFEDSRQSAAILAQFDQLSTGLRPDEAARLLYALAEKQRDNAQWNLVERSYLALVERYPMEPPSRKAMVWLIHYWTGAEPLWRRVRHEGVTNEVVTASATSLADRIQKAVAMSEQGIVATTPEQIAQAGLQADPLESSVSRGTLQVDEGRSLEGEEVRHARQRARQVAQLLRRIDPELYASAEVQLSLPVRAGDEAVSGSGFTAATRGNTSTTAICRRAASPPHLDGVFSDPCWRDAPETKLVSDGTNSVPEGSLMLFAYDEKYLYLAASISRPEGATPPTIELAGRKQDGDVAGYDRIAIALDIDRDFATYYRFEVDARGQVADDCWGDKSWNPKWFVAVDGDANRWRIEAAIPFSELAPRSAQRGELWGVSVSRIIPAVGIQGWPRLSGGVARPEAFGLMRFE